MSLDGWKTYLAAFGLLCLAGYQAFYLGDLNQAATTFLAALAAAGLRSAVAKAESAAKA